MPVFQRIILLCRQFTCIALQSALCGSYNVRYRNHNTTIHASVIAYLEHVLSIAVPDAVDGDYQGGGDAPDFSTGGADDLQLRELAARLKTDLKQLVLFSVADHQVCC